MSGDAITLEGTVTEVRRRVFVVEAHVGALRRQVLAKLSGRLHTHHIRIVAGDLVTVEVSPYDLGRGRITYRGIRPERST